MNPLAWLRQRWLRPKTPHLTAVHEVLRELLPNDEPVVVRYIVAVAVLLSRIAHADGKLVAAEQERLEVLFEHIDRIPPAGIEQLCSVLHENAPRLRPAELERCFGELRSLCDAEERAQVVRLLASEASADGEIHDAEHAALIEVAAALGISEARLALLEEEARRMSRVPLPPSTVPPGRARS